MNKNLGKVVNFSSRIKSEHVRLLVVILTLAMLVLGIGAPADGGGATGRALFGGL